MKSKGSARRVLKGVTKFIEQKMKLKVNRQKTTICRPVSYCILGYNFVSTYIKGVKGKYRLRVNPKTFARMKARVKEITQDRPLRNCPVDNFREGPDYRVGTPKVLLNALKN